MAFFSKYIKKLQLPSDYREAALQAFSENAELDIETEVRFNLKATNPQTCKPGDIITLNYDKKFGSRRFLVVGTDHSSNGKYMSGKGNMLLCGYDLTKKENLPGLVTLFSYFYKLRNCNYKRMNSTMTSIFGPDTFKTFMFSKISNLYDILVEVRG